METGMGVVMWTILFLTSTSRLNGESTASPHALIPGLSLNEVSISFHVTQESKADVTEVSQFTPHNQTSHAATATIPSPSEPNTRPFVRTDTSPPPSSTHTPITGHSTETRKASAPSNQSLFSTRSTSITPGSTITGPSSTADSTGLTDVYQPSSHPSTVSASETFSTVLAASSYPASSLTTLTDRTQPTGAIPLENPHQDGSSELDVGDEDSAKVLHASPWDPLLAALVSIFIVSTALVSVMLFLKFRQQSKHPEFHRLQDLPMDDLLEDTPLSRYSY